MGNSTEGTALPDHQKKTGTFLFPQRMIWPMGVILLSLLAAGWIFRDYLIHPNQHMCAFGGDALTQYYDIAYHVHFGKGTHFSGMNYPNGEYIFMTDAQGVLATLLQYINRYVAPVHMFVPGILHSLNIYLLPVACLMVYYILLFFKVRPWMSMVFAVLIIFLSPPIMRLNGHFGLAYPFLIPIAMLWALRKMTNAKPEWRDLFVACILILFTLNNAYSGFSPSALLFCAGLIMFFLLKKRMNGFKSAALVAGTGLICILVPYLIIHQGDPVTDRLKEQWGFFYYNATLEGLIMAPWSMGYRLLAGLHLRPAPMDSETNMNIGIVTTLILMTALISCIVFFLAKRNAKSQSKIPIELHILFLSALLLFLYAANENIIPISREWALQHLGPLLMFKAVARIGWPFYFACTVYSVVWLETRLKHQTQVWLRTFVPVLLVLIWAAEINNYVSPHYQNTFHDNFFLSKNSQIIKNHLKENHVRTEDYQAMLVIPRMMAWTDIFLCDLNWNAQFFGMRISEATGLPFISAMLSRMSIGQSADAIQMLAHPLIHRDLVDKLPNRKDLLLLVAGGKPVLSAGEQYLIQKSTLLSSSDDFTLYRLQLQDLDNNATLDSARRFIALHPPLPEGFIHLGFDDKPRDVHFFGESSVVMQAGQTVVLDTSLQIVEDTSFIFSAWTRIDHDAPGLGDWRLEVFDPLGNLRSTYESDTRRSYDIQDMWIRSEVRFTAGPGDRLKATFTTIKTIDLDEVMVYPSHSTVILDSKDADVFLYNGYKVKG